MLRKAFKFRVAVSQNPYSTAKSRACALTWFIACYCTSTAFQFRRWLAPFSMATSVKGCTAVRQEHSCVMLYLLHLIYDWIFQVNSSASVHVSQCHLSVILYDDSNRVDDLLTWNLGSLKRSIPHKKILTTEFCSKFEYTVEYYTRRCSIPRSRSTYYRML